MSWALKYEPVSTFTSSHAPWGYEKIWRLTIFKQINGVVWSVSLFRLLHLPPGDPVDRAQERSYCQYL